MESLNDFANFSISENSVFVDSKQSSMTKSIVKFYGKNNQLIVENGVKIVNSKIEFFGNNSIVYISKNKNLVKINTAVYENNVLFIGENVYFNGNLSVILSEEKNVLIGSDCLISFGVWIRTADPHLIYDCDTKSRINPSLSVLIGKHVWIGQQVMILKGATISSGSIVGASSLVPNKQINMNECWAGNPVKLVKRNIFWDSRSVHRFTKETAQPFNRCESEEYIFKEDRTMSFLKKLDSVEANNIKRKLDLILEERKISLDTLIKKTQISTDKISTEVSTERKSLLNEFFKLFRRKF